MKKIIILKHGGGELANQLWNYISVYAYGLEKSIPVYNPSFFEYHTFFKTLRRQRFGTKLLTLLFRQPRRRSHPINRIVRFMYAVWVRLQTKLHVRCLISSENTSNTVVYLKDANVPNCKASYFSGWLFRYPEGLVRHREILRDTFGPNRRVCATVEKIVMPLRQQFKHVIGVHIRQADYASFKGGKYIITHQRVREILTEYLAYQAIDSQSVVFVLASDGHIPRETYEGLNVYISKENAVIDLFLLAKTDAIIGSDSSFGHFASWYGDVPHIIMKQTPVDWDYYRPHTTYFKNKYCTLLPL